MEKQCIVDQMKKLEANYSPEKFRITQPVYDLWIEMFLGLDEEIFKRAVSNYIKENEFPPTIAGIMKCYEEINQYRKFMKDFLGGQYNVMRSVWDEKIDDKTRRAYIDLVFKCPKDKREDFAVDVVHQAVSYYHDCEFKGVKPPTLIEYLGGLT
jgi:hypothetical protein